MLKGSREVEKSIKQEMNSAASGIFSTFNNTLYENDSNCLYVNGNNGDRSLDSYNSHNNHDSITQSLGTHNLIENSVFHQMGSSSESAGYGMNLRDPVFLSTLFNHPFDNRLDLMCSSGFLEPVHEGQDLAFNSPFIAGFNDLNGSGSSLISQNPETRIDDGSGAANVADSSPLDVDSYGSSNPLSISRGEMSRPLDSFISAGTDLNLLQKRLALYRENVGDYGVFNQENSQIPGLNLDKGKGVMSEEDMLQLQKNNGEANVNEINESALLSDSEGPIQSYKPLLSEIISNRGSSVTDVVDKGMKGKPPAKNLMAERRRRKKLNDRLYMLRSVIPKISKMDRASVLVDAVDYLKELLQRVKTLNDELESLAVAFSSPPSTGLVQPPASVLYPSSYHVEESRTSSSIPTDQPPIINIEHREENGFRIHMFCGRRPGLLLSTMSALDYLGLDVQQAVISCFNCFALDIFRAEKIDASLQIEDDQIKAAILDMAAFHGLM